jgi:hypothetical protein
MIDYVYIFGLPHSGSTLLTLLMNAHPEIGTIGELQLLANHLEAIKIKTGRFGCSCGQKIWNCPVFTQVLARHGEEFDRFNFIHGRTFREYPTYTQDQKDSYHRKHKRLVQTILELTHGTIFLDDDKTPWKVPLLIGNPFFNVKVINLVRDGRGVLASWLRRGNDLGLWVHYEKEREIALRLLKKEQYIRIAYEDLCKDTEGQLRTIYDFLGVPIDTIILNYRTGAENHVWGGLGKSRGSEKIILDERWKHELNAHHIKEFNQKGAEINRRNGYNT